MPGNRAITDDVGFFLIKAGAAIAGVLRLFFCMTTFLYKKLNHN